MKHILVFLVLTAAAFAQITNGSQQTFNSTTGTAWQSKQFYDVRDYGIDCSGVTDSTSALQALINTAPDYSSFHFPQACKVKVSGATAITIDQRYGLKFVMEPRNGNNCTGGGPGATQLFYSQAYGAGNRVFYINRSQALEFDNFMVNVNGGGDIGIDIDQIGATPPITTRIDFYSPCVINPVPRNANFVGIRVSQTSISNVENIHFYHPDVQCSSQAVTSSASNGIGILFGGSANLKNEIIEDNRVSFCSTALKTQFGSDFSIRDGLCSSCWTDIIMGVFNDMLSGWRSEFSNIPVSIQNATGPHTIMHNDFAATTGATIIDCGSGCGQVTLIGNETDTATIPWFNTHGGSSSLFSVQNRNTNLDPLQFGYSFNFEPSTGGTNKSWLSTSLRITPGSGLLTQTNSPSPPLIFETVNGAGHVYDKFAIENFAEGNFNNAAPQNFSIFYQGTNANNYITLGSQLIDLKVGGNPTSAPVVNAVSFRGTPGATTWCYAVVANTVNGHSAASTPACVANGNATLDGTNYELIILNWYSGAINYDVYRTTAGGTPSTTGKIGTVKPMSLNGGVIQPGITINDTGLAGDGATAPATNTTGLAVFAGQVQSTVTTGTAPLIVASTTNVANLNASSLGGATFAAPGAIGGGTPAAGTFTTVVATTANGGFSGTEGTGAGVPAGAGLDVLWPDSTRHRWMMNNNNSATSPSVAGTYPSGSVTTAGTAVTNGTCQAQTGITITGALVTDNVVANIGAALPATWQTGIVLSAHVTAGDTVTVYLCNGTAGSITPAATAVFVRLLR